MSYYKYVTIIVITLLLIHFSFTVHRSSIWSSLRFAFEYVSGLQNGVVGGGSIPFAKASKNLLGFEDGCEMM
jgi:hypothetical protein